MKATSLILLGTPFSGAALLGHILGAHAHAFFAGETWRHWDRAAMPSALACPTCGPACAAWSAPAVAAAVRQGPAALAAALADAAGARVVVEAPVAPTWLPVRLADGAATGEDTRIVLCTCDPLRYVRKRAGVTPEYAKRRAVEWHDENQLAVRTALASGRPVLVVPYEELVTRTAETLRRVCAFAGLAADALPEAWEEVPSHALGARTEAWGVAAPAAGTPGRPLARDRRGARVDTWPEFDSDPAAWLDLAAVRAVIDQLRPSGLYEAFGYEPTLPPRREPATPAEWQATREWVVQDLAAVRDAVLCDRAAEAIGTLRMLVDHFGPAFDELRLEATYENLAIVLVDLLENQLRAPEALPYARALAAHNPHNPEARRLLDLALAGCGLDGAAAANGTAATNGTGATNGAGATNGEVHPAMERPAAVPAKV